MMIMMTVNWSNDYRSKGHVMPKEVKAQFLTCVINIAAGESRVRPLQYPSEKLSNGLDLERSR